MMDNGEWRKWGEDGRDESDDMDGFVDDKEKR